MRKYFNIILLIITVLLVSPKIVDAAAFSFKPTQNCKEEISGNDKLTTCDLTLVSDGTTKTSNMTIKLDVSYKGETYKFTAKSGSYGVVSNVKSDETDGSFSVAITSGLPAGEYQIGTTTSYTPKKTTENCGLSFSPTWEGGTIEDFTQDVNLKDTNTGIPIPYIALGTGIVAVLVMYSAIKRSTKMHKI